MLEKGASPFLLCLEVVARICCPSYMICNQKEKREMRILEEKDSIHSFYNRLHIYSLYNGSKSKSKKFSGLTQMHSSKSMYTHGLIMHSSLELVPLRSIRLGLKILGSKSDPRPKQKSHASVSAVRVGSFRARVDLTALELVRPNLESTRMLCHQHAIK